VRLSLDTNALVEVLNDRRPEVRAAFEAARLAGDEMWVSVLVAHELRFGAVLSGRLQERQSVERLLASLTLAPFTEDDADGATAVRAALERKGRRIGAMDMLIAGQAISRGWVVVTANVHEFGRVEGLAIIDWTAPGSENP
jgi:tRNA(fMet)-specific endonuclease VapC